MYGRRRRRRYTGRKRRRVSFRTSSYGYQGRRSRTRVPRIEKKFYDGDLTDAVVAVGAEFADVVSAGPSVLSSTLNDIPIGTSASTRIGRKCTITNIYIRLTFQYIVLTIASLVAVEQSQELIRIILYQDKQSNKANDSAVTKVAQLLTAETYDAFRNLNNSQRFNILYDKTFNWNALALGSGNGTANDSTRERKQYYVKISKKVFIPLDFDSTLGAITELTQNNIGLMYITRFGGRLELTGGQYRLRFIDY